MSEKPADYFDPKLVWYPIEDLLKMRSQLNVIGKKIVIRNNKNEFIELECCEIITKYPKPESNIKNSNLMFGISIGNKYSFYSFEFLVVNEMYYNKFAILN